MKYLLDTSHKTTVVLRPDPEMNQRVAAAEEKRLVEVRSAMDDAELRAVVENTQYLKQIQETPDSPEALATIPQLTLKDVDKDVKQIPIEIDEQYGSKIITHDLFTNDIIYLDVGFNLHVLSQDLLPYIPLFGRALTQIGTDSEDFVKLSQRIGRMTGGIHASTFTSSVHGENEGVVWMFLRGKATSSQSKELLAILSDILLGVKLDNQDRFLQMVLEAKADREARLAPGGHGLVNTRLRALFDESGWVAENMGGISNLIFLRQLEDEVKNNWPTVLARLENIRSILVNRNAMLFNITVDAENWVQLKPKLGDFLRTLPSSTVRKKTWSPNPGASFEGLTIPSQVNFVGKGADLYELGYRIHGSNYPITKYLRTSWLWDRVRVQGGAYGGLCSFNRHSGVFTFLSYRDPNLLDTLDIYDKTGQFLRELDLNQEELTKSIIGAIGDMDAYQLPDAKGYSSMLRYLIGETDENRQQIRDQILETALNDFHVFGEVLDQLSGKGKVVVMGSEEAVNEANATRDNWLNIVKVL
jgi:Zn-dependent M16 (insulinase) family peptidase